MMSTARAYSFAPLTSATIEQKKVDVQTFGQPNLNLQPLQISTAPTELKIQFKGKALKGAALPDANFGPADDAQAFAAPNLDQFIAEVSEILSLFGLEAHSHEGIISEMLRGKSERPADEPGIFEDFGPNDTEVMQHFGHIINPLLNAGIELGFAARITDHILDLSAANFLDKIPADRE